MISQSRSSHCSRKSLYHRNLGGTSKKCSLWGVSQTKRELDVFLRMDERTVRPRKQEWAFLILSSRIPRIKGWECSPFLSAYKAKLGSGKWPHGFSLVWLSLEENKTLGEIHVFFFPSRLGGLKSMQLCERAVLWVENKAIHVSLWWLWDLLEPPIKRHITLK